MGGGGVLWGQCLNQELRIQHLKTVLSTSNRQNYYYNSGSKGGVLGSGPRFLTHDVGFLTLGPKLYPLDLPFCPLPAKGVDKF